MSNLHLVLANPIVPLAMLGKTFKGMTDTLSSATAALLGAKWDATPRRVRAS